jgi:hypothetical protein
MAVSLAFSAGAAHAASVPYTWDSVAIGGGGFVSAIIPAKTEPGLAYARTDVGGAYRWDVLNRKWIPLLDWVNESQTGYLGVESLAVDPKNAANVYMLAGIGYFNNGNTAILRSTDYGKTFTIVDVSAQFKAHGNGMGRQNGEKLVVDPGSSNVLYVGTRYNGLFKSIDSGSTWTRMAALPVTTTPNANGVSFVLPDPSSVTNGVAQKMFVGVSRSGNASPNFYRSDNAGATFTAVSGAPTTMMPQRAVLDRIGNVYLTYANGAGPNGTTAEPMNAGQIWKYTIASGAWTNVTPAGYTMPFGGISVDPTNPARLVTSTMNTYWQQGNAWGDRILTSVNGGATWTDVIARGFAKNMDGVTWAGANAMHWIGSVEFDPADPRAVWATSGNGIYKTADIDQPTTTWTFNVKGLEETVPLNIVSIPGGPVVSTIYDYDGFRHTDVAQYATMHTPAMGHNIGLAVAPLNTATIVRTGSKMYYSTNTGLSWTASALKGPKGQVALSANGAVLLHNPENSTTTYRSTNLGASWSRVSGLKAANIRPVADMVNSSKFYAYEESTGAVKVSTDGGASFVTKSTLSQWGSTVLRAAPGKEGDIWIPLYWGGLARSTDSGTSFTYFGNVTDAAAVGFGKAAVGASYPTVYLWGTVGGVRGLHRSTDTGATWVRVNDDEHEYGGLANGHFVSGDMNTFGVVYMSTAGRGIVYGKPQ